MEQALVKIDRLPGRRHGSAKTWELIASWERII